MVGCKQLPWVASIHMVRRFNDKAPEGIECEPHRDTRRAAPTALARCNGSDIAPKDGSHPTTRASNTNYARCRRYRPRTPGRLPCSAVLLSVIAHSTPTQSHCLGIEPTAALAAADSIDRRPIVHRQIDDQTIAPAQDVGAWHSVDVNQLLDLSRQLHQRQLRCMLLDEVVRTQIATEHTPPWAPIAVVALND
jgi:hypothetical protein